MSSNFIRQSRYTVVLDTTHERVCVVRWFQCTCVYMYTWAWHYRLAVSGILDYRNYYMMRSDAFGKHW